MPAAAVIPAPIAYIKVVAVKKLVVEFLVIFSFGESQSKVGHPSASYSRPLLFRISELTFYFEKIRVFQAGFCPNTLAWNNGIGLWSIWLVIGSE